MATHSPSPFLLDPATVVELGLRSSSPTTQYYEWEATPAPITTRPNNHLQAATVVELGLRSSSPTTQYYEWETTPAPTTTRPNNHLHGGSPAATQYYEWEATPAPTITGPLPSSRETPLESQQPLESSVVSRDQTSRSQNPRPKKRSRNQLSEEEKLSIIKQLY